MEGQKLPKSILYNYGMADLTSNIMISIAIMYYAYFLTDIAMISAAAMGTILLLARIGDAVSVPLSGGVIQKVHLQWGKFRSWLLIAPIITAFFYILIFINFDISAMAKAILFGAGYILAHCSFNFSYNAHLGLISVLGQTAEDRMALSIKKSQFQAVGQVTFSIVVINLLTFLSKTDEARAFLITVVIFSLIQIAGYWNLFFRTAKYDKYRPEEKISKDSKLTVVEMIKQILGNGQLLLLMSAETIKFSMMGIVGLSTYYYKYVAGNMGLLSLHMFVSSILMVIGTIVAQPIVKALGKKPTYLFSCALSGLSFFMVFFLGSSWVWYVCLGGIGIFGSAFSVAMGPAMYMDFAEYGYYKTGKDSSAFIVSMFSLPVKLGVALGAALLGYGLAIIGYNPADEITPELVSGIIKLVSLLPAACYAGPFLIMLFYTLTDTKVAEIMEINKKKRMEAQEA